MSNEANIKITPKSRITKNENGKYSAQVLVNIKLVRDKYTTEKLINEREFKTRKEATEWANNEKKNKDLQAVSRQLFKTMF